MNQNNALKNDDFLQYCIPLNELTISPLAADVNVIGCNVLVPEILPHKFLAEPIRPGAVDPRLVVLLEQGVQYSVCPILHVLDGPRIGTTKHRAPVEIDVSWSAKSRHPEPHLRTRFHKVFHSNRIVGGPYF